MINCNKHKQVSMTFTLENKPFGASIVYEPEYWNLIIHAHRSFHLGRQTENQAVKNIFHIVMFVTYF
jgi:hypothetical protein